VGIRWATSRGSRSIWWCTCSTEALDAIAPGRCRGAAGGNGQLDAPVESTSTWPLRPLRPLRQDGCLLSISRDAGAHTWGGWELRVVTDGGASGEAAWGVPLAT
jgi:hypothetical protein